MISSAGLAATSQHDVPLRDHSWYGLGGPARWFFTPRSDAELADVLAHCAASGIPWRILGRGANVLVRDAGFDGAVIKLAGSTYEAVRFDGALVHAGAAADFTRIVRQSVDRGLSGLESLAGIPGSVGGIIRMNAGGRGACVADCVREVRLLDRDRQVVVRPAGQIGFAYRHSDLAGCVILGATLALQHGDRDEIRTRFRRVWNEKVANQPTISERSAGCIFKNPAGLAAGALLDRAGLKGHRVGGAEISTRHANFIIAHPGATAADVLDLIALAKERVRQRSGVELELEVEIW